MIVFDAGAIIAWLRLKRGALTVRQILRANRGQCYIHAVNLCEIYYGFARSRDVAFAERAVHMLLAAGVTVREDMDTAFWKDAANLKAAHRISLADALCLALGRRLNAEVATTDHHEFDPLVPLGLCRLRFIR